MRIDEIEARKAEIRGILASDAEFDVDALTEEVRSLNEEAQKIEDAQKKAAELRNAVAPAIINEIKENNKENENMENRTFTIDSAEYREAFLKNLMGKPLTTEERAGMDSQTSSGGYAIPTQTLNKVVENMIKVAPMIGEIDLMHIPGNITIPVEGTVNAAALHTENAAITGASDTIVKVSLGGFEIVKVIPISAKLSVMSIDGFENWIVSNLSRSIAYEIENYIINGTGSSQPKGIDASATWTDGTSAVDFAASAPTVAEIEELIGLQNAAYIQNAKFLMNWGTFWNNIHVLRDDKNEPVVRHEGGKYYIFGFEVLFSAKCDNGDIFFGDYYEGVKGNFAQDVTIEANASSGFRSNAVDYRGACIFDCQTVAGRIVKGAATL